MKNTSNMNTNNDPFVEAPVSPRRSNRIRSNRTDKDKEKYWAKKLKLDRKRELKKQQIARRKERDSGLKWKRSLWTPLPKIGTGNQKKLKDNLKNAKKFIRKQQKQQKKTKKQKTKKTKKSENL